MAFCPQSRTFDQNLRFSPVYNPNGQEIPAVAVNSRIIEFYSGTEPDHRGRYLQEFSDGRTTNWKSLTTTSSGSSLCQSRAASMWQRPS